MSTAYATVGDRPWELAPLFHSVNTTKRGITLDLTRPEGRDLARRLLETCDVLVENFTPRVLDSFDLVTDDLLAANPGLIVVRMPAWGLDGAWRERPGFAQTMEQVSGLAWVTGFAGGPPVVPRGPCDPLGGWHAAFAVLAALEQRERTGLGTLIEAPLVEGALNIAAAQLVDYSAHGQLTGRTGNRSPTAAPQNVYRAKGDERWLALSVETDEQWVALRGAIGEPAWARDSALDRSDGRLARVTEIDRELGALFADVELDDLVDRLWSAGVAVAPVINARRVVENAQHAARGFYEQVCHEVAGVVALPRFPGVWAGRTDPWHWRPAPTLGQHNTEVLGSELDLAPDELEQLERHKVIGTRPVLTEG
jgi:crotonobetainyl-CoA:carnitine CoA-transferase CaiB-like acyl-CoA transferase